MTNYQEHLNTQARWILENTNLPHLRGVIGRWNEQNETVTLTYYFNGQPPEEEIEEASIASTEIMATFPTGFLEENYISVEKTKPLPKSEFWVIKGE